MLLLRCFNFIFQFRCLKFFLRLLFSFALFFFLKKYFCFILYSSSSPFLIVSTAVSNFLFYFYIEILDNLNLTYFFNFQFRIRYTLGRFLKKKYQIKNISFFFLMLIANGHNLTSLHYNTIIQLRITEVNISSQSISVFFVFKFFYNII